MLNWLARLAAPRSKSPQAATPEFHRDLAAGFYARGQWREAAAALRQALELDPASKHDWNKLGLACKELGDLEAAAQCFDRALQVAPESAAALSNAASVRRDLGRIDEAIVLFRRVRQLAPDNVDILSAYLFTLNLASGLSREEIFREHLECDRILRAQLPAVQARAVGRATGARMRIGYLSPDLRLHAVACFVEPLLAHHDRAQFEIFCYSLHPLHDAVSARLRGLSDRWVDCAAWTSADIAQCIESDGIDILVDLAGHTDWNRIEVLARKPAPVIATWLGYLNTTGLRCIDYRITDRHTDPPGLTEGFHTEILARLPQSQWCRQKPDQAIAVSPLPAARNGSVTFGSFNKSAKLTAETLALWGRVLLRVPASTLLIAGIEDQRRDAICRALADQGVDRVQFEFAPPLPLQRFRELHHGVDIALDPYPYSGATTTLDSLWMGVPVLTLAPATAEAPPMARSTASILATLGMEDWIARSAEAYVDIAARHAADIAALGMLRAGLRQALESSILMDGARFTAQLEDLYRRMWRERGAAPESAP